MHFPLMATCVLALLAGIHLARGASTLPAGKPWLKLACRSSPLALPLLLLAVHQAWT
jgi:hypothetical protein